jgi:hypothetical protein
MRSRRPKNDLPALLPGGAGKTDGASCRTLATRSVPVRIASRTGSPPPDGNDQVTWLPALQGRRAAYRRPDGDTIRRPRAGPHCRFLTIVCSRAVRGGGQTTVSDSAYFTSAM